MSLGSNDFRTEYDFPIPRGSPMVKNSDMVPRCISRWLTDSSHAVRKLRLDACRQLEKLARA